MKIEKLLTTLHKKHGDVVPLTLTALLCCILGFFLSFCGQEANGAPATLVNKPYPQPHFKESKGAPPYPPHFYPFYPRHVVEMGTAKVRPAISNSYACVKIIKKLIPKYPILPLSVKATATVRKDFADSSNYIYEPPSCGVKIEIPIIDTREKFRERRELLSASNTARKLLENYLEIRTEVNYLYHYLTWLWQRVDVGMEYRKDVWEKEIELRKKQAELKSLTAQFLSLGIKREELDRCYCETYYITNCCKELHLPPK